MKFLRQSLVGLFLTAVSFALVIYAVQMVATAIQAKMAEESRTPQPRERIFAVNVLTAERATATPILEVYGEVRSRRTLELRSAAGGRIVALSENFVEGGVVRRGDLLLRVEPANAKAALDRAKSDLLDAQAEQRDAQRGLDLAKDELEAAREQAELRQRAFERQTNLSERGVGTTASVETAELAAAQARQSVLSSRMSLTQAEARIDQAATQLARAEISLRTAERDLADTSLTAAFNGTLSDVSLVEGRLVQANERVANLVESNALEVAFRVSTAQYVRLLDEDGSLLNAPVRVSLSVAGIGLEAEGRISRDSAAVGEGLSGRLLFARLDTAPGFKPGDFVTVEVEEPEVADVFRLPASALDSKSTVLVLGPEERLEVLPVTLVRRQGDDVLVRADGLEGREVVVGRTPLLGPGIRVRPLRPQTGEQTAQAGPAMVKLTDARRAKLVSFVSANNRMPADVKARILGVLEQDEVPEPMIQRLESRMGG